MEGEEAPVNAFVESAAKQKIATNSQLLVELKAGKMFIDSNGLVKPDPRRGLVCLSKSEEGLVHFCWKDRKTDKTEDDLIIFPNDAEWLKVNQSAGRVYLLKFSSRRLFFWMQEPDSRIDGQFAKKINKLINNTQFQNFSESDGITIGATDTHIKSVLSLDCLRPIIGDPILQKRLFPLIPRIHNHTETELLELIQSVQFQEALSVLNDAFESGDMGPLIIELGLDSVAAMKGPNRVLSLLREIGRKFSSRKIEHS